MQVALHGNELFVFVGVGEGRGALGLNLVPLAVDLGEGMNVVGERVAVGDFHFLAHAKHQNVGGVLAALPIAKDGGGGTRAGIGRAFGNINDDVADRVAG